MQLKKYLALICLYFTTSTYAAPSIEGSYGMFSLNGESSNGSASVSSPGHFSFGLSYELMSKFELFASYSIMNESFISGDRAYGPNLGVRYYHWGNGETIVARGNGISLHSSYHYLPYLKMGFAQRQYQSVRASYSGPQVGIGVLTNSLYKDLPILFEITRAALGGEQNATADEMSIMVGIQWRLP